MLTPCRQTDQCGAFASQTTTKHSITTFFSGSSLKPPHTFSQSYHFHLRAKALSIYHVCLPNQVVTKISLIQTLITSLDYNLCHCIFANFLQTFYSLFVLIASMQIIIAMKTNKRCVIDNRR